MSKFMRRFYCVLFATIVLSFSCFITTFAEDVQQNVSDTESASEMTDTTEQQSSQEGTSPNSSEQSTVTTQSSTPPKTVSSDVTDTQPQNSTTSSKITSSSPETSKPDYDYGDERGIIVGNGKYLTIPATDGIMNGSFEQGFKYWTTLAGSKPEDVATAVKEKENTYIKIIGGNVKDALVTPKFNAGNVMAGQRLVIIYDWCGSKDFVLNLNQVTGDNVTTIGTGYGETIVGDGTGNDWSTSITNTVFDVIANYTDDGKLQFTVELAASQKAGAVTFIDNIRVGIFNKNNKHIYDVYGNLLYDTSVRDTSAANPQKNSEKQSDEELSKNNSDDDETSRDNNLALIIYILLAIFGLSVMLFIVYKFWVKSKFAGASDRRSAKNEIHSSFTFEEESEDNN